VVEERSRVVTNSLKKSLVRGPGRCSGVAPPDQSRQHSMVDVDHIVAGAEYQASESLCKGVLEDVTFTRLGSWGTKYRRFQNSKNLAGSWDHCCKFRNVSYNDQIFQCTVYLDSSRFPDFIEIDLE
jgi:hypothetical protein